MSIIINNYCKNCNKVTTFTRIKGIFHCSICDNILGIYELSLDSKFEDPII